MSAFQLQVETDGRFLCIRVTNRGEPDTFSGVVQPGRGTASAAIARTALWHEVFDAERRIDTGQSAVFRIAQRDRPPLASEDDDHQHLHPEGPQAWRLCFLKKGIGASLERVCPVIRRDESSEHDGVVLTVISGSGRAVVKSVLFNGELAIDADTQEQFRVLDSARHYHAAPASSGHGPF